MNTITTNAVLTADDLALPYCLYISEHQSGRYYVGKGETKKVLTGKYLGSGTDFKAFFKANPHEWNTEVLVTCADDLDAFLAEKVVDEEMLDDPACLNIVRGGGGYHGRTVQRLFELMHERELSAFCPIRQPKEYAACIRSFYRGYSQHRADWLTTQAAKSALAMREVYINGII